MSMFRAVRPAPPGVDAACLPRLQEVDRLEWRVGDGGDPADLAADFHARYAGAHTDDDGAICGVAVLISAAAGAVMVGGATGAPSPVPAVPDLVLVAYRHGPAREPEVHGPFALGPWRASWSDADHVKAIVAVQEMIARGQVYVANVVGHRRASWSGDPGAIAAAAAGVTGAAWGGVLAGEDWLVASGSPECFVTTDGARAATYPIKGTAPATEDGRAALLGSVKERAEHVMIVDLERNDLARVAVPGTVAVEGLFRLGRWADLWQAESTVTAALDPDAGLAELLRAMCPPGSVTGAPKLAVLDLVGGLEPVGRGPAMGGFGFISGDRVRLGVTIRTVALDAAHAHVWSGGGITWRSEPEAEVAEAEAKAAAVAAALGGTV
jgi:para-aminobenzoate synthetase component 1